LGVGVKGLGVRGMGMGRARARVSVALRHARSCCSTASDALLVPSRLPLAPCG